MAKTAEDIYNLGKRHKCGLIVNDDIGLRFYVLIILCVLEVPFWLRAVSASLGQDLSQLTHLTSSTVRIIFYRL
jgi:hypothetical protein